MGSTCLKNVHKEQYRFELVEVVFLRFSNTLRLTIDSLF